MNGLCCNKLACYNVNIAAGVVQWHRQLTFSETSYISHIAHTSTSLLVVVSLLDIQRSADCYRTVHFNPFVEGV